MANTVHGGMKEHVPNRVERIISHRCHVAALPLLWAQGDRSPQK